MKKIMKVLGLIMIFSMALSSQHAYAAAADYGLEVGSKLDASVNEFIVIPITLTKGASSDSISGVFSTLRFEPAFLQAQSIEMGTLIPHPEVWNNFPSLAEDEKVIYKIDNTTGEIKFIVFDTSAALGNEDGSPLASSNGQIALVTFKAMAAVENTAITIYGEDALVHLFDNAGVYDLELYNVATLKAGTVQIAEAAGHDITVITPPAPAQGSIVVPSEPIADGGTAIITITPNQYYRVNDVMLDGASLLHPVRDSRLSLNSSTGVETITLTDVSEDHVINNADIGIFYGDANGNRSIGTSDALVVLEHDAGITAIPAGSAQAQAADVNANTAPGIRTSDALLILEYDAGLINKFPVEP